MSFRVALHQLGSLGADHDVGWTFWAKGAKALDAIRRVSPDLANLLSKEEADAKARVAYQSSLHLGPEPPTGKRAGSIVVGGATYWRDEAGRVVRNGKSTDLDISPAYNCSIVVNLKSCSWRPRRHYVAQGGRRVAHLDAALLIEAKLSDDPLWHNANGDYWAAEAAEKRLRSLAGIEMKPKS